MEVKINSRLFFMGTICVLVTALVTSLFFRTAFYNQAEENIRSITETAPISLPSAARDTGSHL